MQEKTWYYEKWGGRHTSFPPRRSVNIYHVHRIWVILWERVEVWEEKHFFIRSLLLMSSGLTSIVRKRLLLPTTVHCSMTITINCSGCSRHARKPEIDGASTLVRISHDLFKKSKETQLLGLQVFKLGRCWYLQLTFRVAINCQKIVPYACHHNMLLTINH